MTEHPMARNDKAIADFKKKYPLDDWDGDAQEFFETVNEEDLIAFFKDLYDK